MTMTRGRHGDSERKKREAYQQHNGFLVGTAKYIAEKLTFWRDDD